MIFRKGIVHIGVIVLALVGLAVASSLSVSARHATVGRPFGNFRERLCIANPGSIFCRGKINASPRPTASPSLPPSVEKGPCYPIGDVDNNKVVNASDAEAILHYIAGTKSIDPYKDRADVNKDGAVTAVDAQLIRRYLAGSVKTFSACTPVVSSIIPNPITPSINKFVTIVGRYFGSSRGTVLFEGKWSCDAGKPPAVWTDTKIVCSPDATLPVGKYFKVTIVRADGLSGTNYSVRTQATSSAVPIATSSAKP